MNSLRTLFEDVFLLKSINYIDERGYFSINYLDNEIEKAVGRKISFCQDNITYSKKGVLRGLHYQLPPYSQSKLVSVIHGKVLDVVLDIRKGSPTFGQHFSQVLSDENQLQLFIPRGYAHGYITLSETSTFMYKVDQFYKPNSEGSIAANDPALKIDWKLPELSWIQSEKDQNHPFLKDASLFDFKVNLYA